MSRIFTVVFLVYALLIFGVPTNSKAGELDRPGWVVHVTSHSFKALNDKLTAAIKAEKMGKVTTASASGGAKKRGITIPGNRIVGVYRNDFAVRMLEASLAAGIEAPVRFYLTENADGGSTLAYKTPTTVFTPYFDEGGDDLKTLASELDQVFAAIAALAISE